MNGKTIPLNMPFSKGLVVGYGDNLVPEQYSSNLKNVRINNGGITNRKGYEELFEAVGHTEIRCMINVDGIIYFMGKRVSTGDMEFVSITDIEGTPIPNVITAMGAAVGYNHKLRMLNYGNEILILIGNGDPYLYNIDSGLMIQLSIGTHLPTLCINPAIGVIYSNSSIIASGKGIYTSNPIEPSTNINFHNFIGIETEEELFPTEVVGLSSGPENFYVFTKNGDIYDAMFQSGSKIVTDKLGNGGELYSPESAINIEGVCYFLTKEFEIKAIKYREGVDTKEITTLSNQEILGIDVLLQSIRETAFIVDTYYDRENKLVKFMFPDVSTTTSPDGLEGIVLNDGVIISYDLVNQTFLVDDNNNYTTYIDGGYVCNGIGTSANGIGYLTNCRIYKVETGNLDNLNEIPWQYRKTITLGNPTVKKQFRGLNYSGKSNSLYAIKVNVMIDGHNVGDYILNTQHKAYYTNFNQNITKANLRKKGKKMYLTFSAETSEQFIIDYLDIIINPAFSSYGKFDTNLG